MGTTLQVQWSLPSTLPPNTNLFIKHLDPETSSSELSQLFGAYGNILSIKVGTNARGEGYGFVLYDTAESAKEAMEAMHNQEFRGQQLYVLHDWTMID